MKTSEMYCFRLLSRRAVSICSVSFIAALLLLHGSNLDAHSQRLELAAADTSAAVKKIAKPYFTLLLNANLFNYEVRFNDVPQDSGDQSTGAEFPLNNWIFPGKNTISVIIKGKPSENANMKIEIKVRGINDGFDKEQTISGMQLSVESKFGIVESNISYPDTGKSSIKKNSAGETVVSRSFTANPPFKKWRWLYAQVVKQDKSTFKDLVAEYQSFWELLKKKDTKAIVSEMQYALKEYMAAYYITDNKTAIADFEVVDLTTDPKTVLADFIPENLKLEVFGNGRLARLVDAKGLSPIKFKDRALDVHIDLMFCKLAGRWVLIR